MIDIFIVEEMILQSNQNELKRKQLLLRIESETSYLKRNNFLQEVQHIEETNKEIHAMLVEEYLQGMSTHQLFEEING